MSNMRISWPNRLGGGTYTGPVGQWTTNLPPSYLATKQIAQVARSLGTDAVVYCDAGSAVEVGTFAAVGHNMSTTGTLRLRGLSSAPAGVDLDLRRSVDDTCTFTRSTVGTYFDAAGVLQTAAIDVPRYDYAAGVSRGLLIEGAATNLVLWCRDMSNAYWDRLSVTAAKTATGIDGVASSASRLTASSSSARCYKQYALGAASRVVSVYLRRVSGTGTIKFGSAASGNATVTLTTSWQRFSEAVSTANPYLCIEIATSGDVIEADFAQLESGPQPTSPIATTTVTVARSGDVLRHDITQSIVTGTLAVRGWVAANPTSADFLVLTSDAGFGPYLQANAGTLYAITNSSSSDGSVSLGALAVGDSITTAMTWALNDSRAAHHGALGTQDTSVSVITESGTNRIYAAPALGAFVLQRIRVWATPLANADLQAISADSDSLEFTAGYDSGTVDAWPTDWVSATNAEQRAGVVGCSVITPAAAQTYRYWRLDLSDSANTDGYLQIGRLFGGTSWAPTYNAVYGASLGYEGRDQINEMDSGSEYMRSRPAPRVASFSFPALTDAESIGTVLDMQRRMGNTGEVLFEWQPADTTYAPARRFLARLRRADPLTAAWVDGWAAQFEAKELL